jgi:hypothetical protein
MINELDVVALKRDLPQHGLVTGDPGTVVHRFSNGAAFLVEFVRDDGSTVAVEELTADDVRQLSPSERGRPDNFDRGAETCR